MNPGKSTIATFVKAVLYGINKNKNGDEYSELERYKPWDNGAFSGSIEYSIDNDKYTVTREFKNNSTKVFKDDGEDISSDFDKDKSRGIDVGFEQLNIDEETFENSVYIGQESIGVNESSQNSILQKLSNIIQSGDEDISFEKVSNRLNKKLYEDVGTDRTTTKPKYILRKKIEELKLKEESLIKNKTRHEYIISESFKLHEEEDKTKIELEKVKEVLKTKTKYEEEIMNQKNKFEAIQSEKTRTKKEELQQIKKKKMIDISIIIVALVALIAFLAIKELYIYIPIAVVVRHCCYCVEPQVYV